MSVQAARFVKTKQRKSFAELEEMLKALESKTKLTSDLYCDKDFVSRHSEAGDPPELKARLCLACTPCAPRCIASCATCRPEPTLASFLSLSLHSLHCAAGDGGGGQEGLRQAEGHQQEAWQAAPRRC